jgi:hypothetical protein
MTARVTNDVAWANCGPTLDLRGSSPTRREDFKKKNSSFLAILIILL